MSLIKKYSVKSHALDVSKDVITAGIVVDEAAIFQSLEMIIMSGFSERVFEPGFGSFIPTMIFKNMTSEVANNILTRLIKLIKRFEDRIYIFEPQCKINVYLSAATLEITIPFKIIASGTNLSFNKRIVF